MDIKLQQLLSREQQRQEETIELIAILRSEKAKC